jgi:hypothetical protein
LVKTLFLRVNMDQISSNTYMIQRNYSMDLFNGTIQRIHSTDLFNGTIKDLEIFLIDL